jgi:hypothetical protein
VRATGPGRCPSEADYFYDELGDLYARWLDEMTPSQRADLFTANARATGASANWLLADDDRLDRYVVDLDWDDGAEQYRARV